VFAQPNLSRVRWLGRNVEVKAFNKEGGLPERAAGVQPLRGVEHTCARNVGQEARERLPSP
jgi:hypothetical protein